MTFKFVPPSAEELAARGIVTEQAEEKIVEAKAEEPEKVVEKPVKVSRKKAASAA